MRRASALGLLALAALSTGCSDGEPIVLESVRLPSPDATHELIVEKLDNGLGFGLGRIVVEVHMQDAGTPVNYHGDGSVTAVFYVVEEHESNLPVVEWLGNDQVSVTYYDVNQPGRKVPHYMGVSFDYTAKSANEP